MSNLKNQLEKLLKQVPNSALKSWLKMHDKPHSSSNNIEFEENLLKWIKEDKISINDIENAVIDIEENGGKKIKLKVMEGFDLEKLKSLLTAKGLSLSKSDKISLRENRRPKLNYIYYDNSDKPTLKIKWSEKQDNVDIDYNSLSLTKESKSIFILVVIETQTGFTEIRFDTPLDHHDHKDAKKIKRDDIYEAYYMEELRNILPLSFVFKNYNLDKIANYLHKNEKEKFEMKNETVKVSKNGVQRYSINNGDIRDLPARKGAEEKDGENWDVKNLTGEWKADKSDGNLTRDLFMRLYKYQSTINFQRDCISKELNYAIREIRSIKEKI